MSIADLISSIEKGNEDLAIKIIDENKCFDNTPNNKFWSCVADALIIAIKYDHEKIINNLIARTQKENFFERQSVIIFTWCNLKMESELNPTFPIWRNKLDDITFKLFDLKLELNIKDRFSDWTLLARACINKLDYLAIKLIDCGADIEIKDTNFRSPIDYIDKHESIAILHHLQTVNRNKVLSIILETINTPNLINNCFSSNIADLNTVDMIVDYS